MVKKIEHEPALVRIGKNGITPAIIDELKNLIVIKKAVKVKILQNAGIENVKETFNNIQDEINQISDKKTKLLRTKGKTGIFIYASIEK